MSHRLRTMIRVRLHSLLNLSTMWLATLPLFVHPSATTPALWVYLCAYGLLLAAYRLLKRREGLQRLMIDQALVVGVAIGLHGVIDHLLYEMEYWLPSHSSANLMGLMALCCLIDLLYLRSQRRNPVSPIGLLHDKVHYGRHAVIIAALIYLAIYIAGRRAVLPIADAASLHTLVPIGLLLIVWGVDYRHTTLRKIRNLQALSADLPSPLLPEDLLESHLRVAIIRGQEVWYSFHKPTRKRTTLQTKRYESRKEAIDRLLCKSPLPVAPKFLLRYFTEEPKGKRIVYLYILNLPEQYEPEGWLSRGAFYEWDELYGMADRQHHSEYFKEELRYLKHTILLANSVRKMNKK